MGSECVRFRPPRPASRNLRPTEGMASNRSTAVPACASTSAAIKPAGPPPTTATRPPNLLHHLGDGLGDVVDVLAVQGGHADAAALDAIDTELVAQADHLVFAQARVAEHADLLLDEAEVALDALGLELFHQRAAHLLDAHAHAGQLLFPQR